MKINLLNKAQLAVINKNHFRYPLAVAEKDYFLAVVLKIIYGSKLKDSLVFKGGTAIHHLYLDQLRFSEDLDFTALKPVSIDEIKEVFKPYNFLEIVKHYPSDFALRINRLKFIGPLGQANSIKLDIDLTQKLIKPAQKLTYNNIFNIDFKVSGMAPDEICAEKIRAVNERARYRDFYDLAMLLKKYNFHSSEIVKILKRKELRKPLSQTSFLANLEMAEEARKSGNENLYYREELDISDVNEVVNNLLI